MENICAFAKIFKRPCIHLSMATAQSKLACFLRNANPIEQHPDPTLEIIEMESRLLAEVIDNRQMVIFLSKVHYWCGYITVQIPLGEPRTFLLTYKEKFHPYIKSFAKTALFDMICMEDGQIKIMF